MRKFTPLLLLIFVFCVTQSVFCYTVVLKNGKIKEGTLLVETDDFITLKDSSGIQMTFKKTTIDLAKTSEKNVVPPVPPPAEVNKPTEPVAPATPALPADPAKDAKPAKPAQPEVPAKPAKPAEEPKSKKPARVLKEEDLEKLREKYDFGSSSGTEDDQPVVEEDPPSSDNSEERSESDWKNSSTRLRDRAELAQKVYTTLQTQCQTLQGITVQTHILVDGKGAGLPVQETVQIACEQADQAKLLLDRANEEYQSFLSEAKLESVPPGWIRNPDGTDPER